MQFAACLHFIPERGRASLPLLAALVEWGKKTLAESPQTFDETDVYNDALTALVPYLGCLGYKNATDGKGLADYEWKSANHRAAAIMELLRVYVLCEKRNEWSKEDDFSKIVFTKEFLGNAVNFVYADSMREFMRNLK